MSTGPIEFLSDSAPRDALVTEYGGTAGMVQPAPHEMTPSEQNNALMRASLTRDGIDPVTGVAADDID